MAARPPLAQFRSTQCLLLHSALTKIPHVHPLGIPSTPAAVVPSCLEGEAGGGGLHGENPGQIQATHRPGPMGGGRDVDSSAGRVQRGSAACCMQYPMSARLDRPGHVQAHGDVCPRRARTKEAVSSSGTPGISSRYGGWTWRCPQARVHRVEAVTSPDLLHTGTSRYIRQGAALHHLVLGVCMQQRKVVGVRRAGWGPVPRPYPPEDGPLPAPCETPPSIGPPPALQDSVVPSRIPRPGTRSARKKRK